MLEAINAFVAIADTGSFRAAGRKLNKSQAAISQLIQNFEIDLGYTLFERQGRSVKLSEKAESLLKEARVLQAQVLHFERRASTLSPATREQLSLGIDPLIAPPSVTQTLTAFEVLFPNAELHLVYRDSESLHTMLNEREVDMTITAHLDKLDSDNHVQVIDVIRNHWIANSAIAENIESSEALFELSSYRLLSNNLLNKSVIGELAKTMNHWCIEDNLTIIKLCQSNHNLACIPHFLLPEIELFPDVVEVTNSLLPVVNQSVLMSWHRDSGSKPCIEWLAKTLTQDLDLSQVYQVVV